MKDLIKKIEGIIGHYYCEDSYYNCSAIGSGCDGEIRECDCGLTEKATKIAESIVIDEEKFIGECQWFWEENENGNNDGTLEELYKSLSKGEILKCK